MEALSAVASAASPFTIDDHAVKPTPDDVYGVISLMFWSITLVVSVKYIGIVMRADNEGEGGVMALVALVRRLLGEGRSGARAIPVRPTDSPSVNVPPTADL